MAVKLSGFLVVTASVFPHNKIDIRYFPLISSELQELFTLVGLPAVITVIIIITMTITIIITNKSKQRVPTSLL